MTSNYDSSYDYYSSGGAASSGTDDGDSETTESSDESSDVPDDAFTSTPTDPSASEPTGEEPGDRNRSETDSSGTQDDSTSGSQGVPDDALTSTPTDPSASEPTGAEPRDRNRSENDSSRGQGVPDDAFTSTPTDPSASEPTGGEPRDRNRPEDASSSGQGVPDDALTSTPTDPSASEPTGEEPRDRNGPEDGSRRRGVPDDAFTTTPTDPSASDPTDGSPKDPADPVRVDDDVELGSVSSREEAASQFDRRYENVDINTGMVTRDDEGFRLSEDAQTDLQRRQAASQFNDQVPRTVNTDDVRQNEEGEFVLREGLQEGIAEQRAVEQFDEQFPDEDIGQPDVVETEGGFELRDAVAQRLGEKQAAEQFEAQFDGVDIEQSDVRETEDGFELTEQARQRIREDRSENEVSPENDPGTVATAVGVTASTLGNSPIGSAADRVTDPLFGDTREEGVVGEIDSFLADVERGWQNNVTAAFEGEAAGSEMNSPAPGVMISPQLGRDLTERTAELSNPGTAGRDIVTVADSAVRGTAFLADRGPEGAQVAKEIAIAGAQEVPDATQAAGRQIVQNPRDAALTGGALAATFGAGAVASRATRASASVAARGARAGTRRADDVVSLARSRSGSLRERAPDVSVRRDPDAGPLEVDPMLQQQLRNRVRSGADIASDAGDADGSLARRLGSATERAQINARLNADVATSRVRDAIPDRSSLPDRPSGPDGSLARKAGRTTRSVELNALLNADAATSRVREAIPDSDSIPNTNLVSGGDESLARQAGRRYESERQSLRLTASAAPSAVRSQTADAAAQLVDLVPSRPDGLSFSDSSASLARRAGRRYESERRSLALTASAAPRAARARVSNAGDAVLSRAEDIAGRPRDALDNLERPDVDLDLGLRDGSFSVPRPDQRARDAVAAASEATVRIGPIRPGRTDVEIGDLDLDLDRFDENELDLGLGSSGGGGGRGSDAIDLDLDSDVDTGGTGAGSDQIATIRTTRRGSRDVDVDGEVRARERAASGPDVGRVDPLAGISGVTAGVFGQSDVDSTLGNAGEAAFDAGAVEDPFIDAGGSDLEFEALSPGLNLETPPTDVTTLGPTSTTTTTTDIDMETTSVAEAPPATTSPPPYRPPKVPSFDMPDGDRSDDEFTSGVEIEDDTFDTGVADADEVFENLF